MMRALVIDGAARAEAARVVSYAMDHPYRPGPGVAPPGDDPGHVAQLNTFRAVFSFTTDHGVTFRHLSISVPGEGFPNPAAAYSIAALFGFTGWDGHTIDRVPPGWALDVHMGEHAIVLVQKIATAALPVSGPNA